MRYFRMILAVVSWVLNESSSTRGTSALEGDNRHQARQDKKDETRDASRKHARAPSDGRVRAVRRVESRKRRREAGGRNKQIPTRRAARRCPGGNGHHNHDHDHHHGGREAISNQISRGIPPIDGRTARTTLKPSRILAPPFLGIQCSSQCTNALRNRGSQPRFDARGADG